MNALRKQFLALSSTTRAVLLSPPKKRLATRRVCPHAFCFGTGQEQERNNLFQMRIIKVRKLSQFQPLSPVLENKPRRYCSVPKRVFQKICLFSNNSRLAIASPPTPLPPFSSPARRESSPRPADEGVGNRGRSPLATPSLGEWQTAAGGSGLGLRLPPGSARCPPALGGSGEGNGDLPASLAAAEPYSKLPVLRR